jgi:hypothetical protein
VASATAEGRVYATFDGHRNDDFKPYIYVSEDYGATWQQITNGIPEFHTVSVIREHPRNPDLLFAGTERGLYVSVDRGARWRRFKADLPTVPIDDLQIHPRENDLILATHGRGIIICDDISLLEHYSKAKDADAYLAPLRNTVLYRQTSLSGASGNKFYFGPNPQIGARVQFWLKEVPQGGVKLEVLDKGNKVVRTISTTGVSAGWNLLYWNGRYDPVTVPTTSQRRNIVPQRRPDGATTVPQRRPGGATTVPQPTFGGGGGAGTFGGGGAPRALPGTYTVRLTVGDKVQVQPVAIEDDPKLTVPLRDRKAQFDLQVKVGKIAAQVQEDSRQVSTLRTRLSSLTGSADYKNAPEEVKKSVVALNAVLQELAGRVSTLGIGGTGARTPLTTRLSRLLGEIGAFTEAPSKTHQNEARVLEGEAKKVRRDVEDVVKKRVPALNKQLEAAKLPVLEG